MENYLDSYPNENDKTIFPEVKKLKLEEKEMNVCKKNNEPEIQESRLECDDCNMRDQCRECENDRVCCNCDLDCDDREE